MAMRYYAPYPGRGGEPFGGPGHEQFRAVAPHMLRIGDAERDAAAADLGEHYVAGRLSLDELHHRLGAVFSARTYGQLTRVMADLPRLRPVLPPVGFPPPHIERRNSTPSDRAGRFAALSLLVLAMLIWLLTALLFARHGFYYQMGPPGPR